MTTNDIWQHLGVEPNEMQQATASAFAADDRNIVVLSPTGSGKTLAYMVPLAQAIDTTSDSVQAVVIVPGRELAEQSEQVLRKTGCGVRSVSLHGGRPAMDEHRLMRRVLPQVVFGTPGRLNDHLDKANFDPSSVRWIVIDEFDKCLEMGFDGEMTRLMGSLPTDARRLLLSATDTDEIPRYLGAMDGKTTAVINRLGDERHLSERITTYEVRSADRDKLETLGRLLLSLEGQTVVFLNYRESVERTAQWLRSRGFTVSLYHGGLDQRERERALYLFSNGSAPVLVATDLASRGLDFPDTDNVIHYHLPETETAYKHRTGRTARWNRTGRTFFILGPDEKMPAYVAGTVQPFEPSPSPDAKPQQPRMATIYIGKGRKDKISRGDILGFLCKKCCLSASDIGLITVGDFYAYAAVAFPRVAETLERAKGQKIKGLKTVFSLRK